MEMTLRSTGEVAKLLGILDIASNMPSPTGICQRHDSAFLINVAGRLTKCGRSLLTLRFKPMSRQTMIRNRWHE